MSFQRWAVTNPGIGASAGRDADFSSTLPLFAVRCFSYVRVIRSYCRTRQKVLLRESISTFWCSRNIDADHLPLLLTPQILRAS